MILFFATFADFQRCDGKLRTVGIEIIQIERFPFAITDLKCNRRATVGGDAHTGNFCFEATVWRSLSVNSVRWRENDSGY